APHQQAAQRDDEGRNFEIGDDEALNRTYDQAEGYAYEEGNQPDPGIAQFETHLLHENARLHHAHYHADETLDRTDRQVNVAHDDDQDHPGRHYRHRRALYRQVPQVPRRKEQSARHKMEKDPDQGERRHHAEHAGVEFR